MNFSLIDVVPLIHAHDGCQEEPSVNQDMYKLRATLVRYHTRAQPNGSAATLSRNGPATVIKR